MDKLTHYTLRSNNVHVLHQDEHIIVLDKPSGLLVIPDRYDATLPNLLSLLRVGEEGVLVVHRIDKETSGCIVYARTPAAHANLNGQFEGRSVDKTYLALCKGVPSSPEGVIDLPLRENETTHRMKVDRKRGKESVTEFRVREAFSGYSLVEARPRTGRMHQIRVHFAAAGMPIIGDSFYGDGKPFMLSVVKRGYKAGKEAEKPLLSRTALHAEQLSFNHPGSDERVSFSAPLPKDMRSTVRMLRKYSPSRN